MERRPTLPAVLAIAAVTSLSVLTFGLAPAPAAEKQFYTRKKVHGRWITGRFRVETGRRFASVQPTAELPSGPVPPARPSEAASPAGRDPERELSTASIAMNQDGAARTELLRAALEMRARSLADAPVDLPEPAPPPPLLRLTPSVVTFDYRAGTRTTRFEDGAVVSEPFDASAGPPPIPSR